MIGGHLLTSAYLADEGDVSRPQIYAATMEKASGKESFHCLVPPSALLQLYVADPYASLHALRSMALPTDSGNIQPSTEVCTVTVAVQQQN